MTTRQCPTDGTTLTMSERAGVELDYFAVVDPSTFEPVPDEHHGPARALIAARLGDTRLIDTELLTLG